MQEENLEMHGFQMMMERDRLERKSEEQTPGNIKQIEMKVTIY